MRYLAAAVLALAGVQCAAQAPKVPGLDCKPKIIALYEAGPNWNNSNQYVPQHLDFLRAQLKKGTLAVGGPFLGREKPGGLMVLNVTDPKDAEALLQQDPFVANKVVTYTTRVWAHCRAESAAPAK